MAARRMRRCHPLILLVISISLLVGISIHHRLSVIINKSNLFVKEEPWYAQNANASTEFKDRRRRLSSNEHSQTKEDKEPALRILYIVTSLAEYQNGRRFTTRGDDRLVNFMLPVLVEGIESILAKGYHVDLYLICHWNMRPRRRLVIQEALPNSVKLQVWDDATPIGYKLENQHNHTDAVTRGLARQHRYVIKDKLMEYDMFLNFEDDMLVKGEHVEQYLNMSRQLASLRAAAPTTRFAPKKRQPMQDIFHGSLQKVQFDRLVPGLMRVEVLRTEETHGAQAKLDPIPVDLVFDGGETQYVDPKPCCHVSAKTASNATHIPQSPTSDKVFIWETGIKGLAVREIDGMGWVMLQSGSFLANRNRCIGSYWSGRDGYFGNETRPFPGDPLYLNNQGGWMATREQILAWHTQQCPCGFLPPFDKPCYDLDGLDWSNVEYWSGGMSLFQSYKACNLQRVISLDPDQFSRQLVYHTANNKQRQLKQRGKQDRFVKVHNLLGQLNTVKKNAIAAKKRELEQ